MSVDAADKKLSKSFINSDFVVSEKNWVVGVGVMGALEIIVSSVEVADGSVRDGPDNGMGCCIS
jgi:hypothetical protein